MRQSRSILALMVVGAGVLGFACGGSGSGSNRDSSLLDGAVLYGQSCVACHDNDGDDIADPTAAGIAAAIDDPATGMGALKGAFSQDQLSAMSRYLTTGEHSSGWRDEDEHGNFADDEGVASCEECHGGPPLEGDGAADSCYKCHGKKW